MSDESNAPQTPDEELVAETAAQESAETPQEAFAAEQAKESEKVEPAPTPEESVEVMRDRWLRAVAELDNFRKRAARDRQAGALRERSNILQSLLPVADNLERAITAQGGASNQWIEGMEAILRQMLDAMAQHGLRPFDAMKEAFDPARHEVITTANLKDKEDGSIVEVVQSGYEMEGLGVIRPAKVIVVRHDS